MYFTVSQLFIVYISSMRFKYDIHFTDGLHVNLTRLNNAEFPDLTRQGAIDVATDKFLYHVIY